jgi:hypothetical protein
MPLADGKTWVTMRTFGYDVGTENSGDTVEVRVGFMTDFATVPRLFWSGLPQWGKYGNASVIHDWLYWVQTRPRDEADQIFLEGMTVSQVRLITRYAMFYAVRWFGWLAWYRNQMDRASGFDRVISPPELQAGLKAGRVSGRRSLTGHIIRKMLR